MYEGSSLLVINVQRIRLHRQMHALEGTTALPRDKPLCALMDITANKAASHLQNALL